MSLREIIASARRAQRQLQRREEEEAARSLQWEEVRAVAHRVVMRGRSSGNYGWDAAMRRVADPQMVKPPPAVDAIGRSWDRVAVAIGAVRPSPVDGHSRVAVSRPGDRVAGC